MARAAGTRDVSPLPVIPAGSGEDGRRRATVAACTYSIRPGDTLGSIAARHFSTSRRWPDLARANPGIDPNRLRVGAVINLPCQHFPDSSSLNVVASAFAACSEAADEASIKPGSACTTAAGQGAPKTKQNAPLAGTGFLAWLSGQKTPAAANSGKTEAGKKGGAAAAEKKAGSGGGAKKTASGSGKKPPAAKPGAEKPSRKANTKAAASSAPPPPPPLPTWTAKAGEDFAVVLHRWAKSANYRVVTGTSDAWTLGVPVHLQGDFETAVNQLVRGLGSDGQAPPVRIYSNRVVRLGGL